MKIISLLPSATEIVYALGLEDQLEAVTFECNWPPEAQAKPVVSGTALPVESLGTTAAIDAAVRSQLDAGEPIYTLDRELITSIQPDLILAQDLCRVCAVPSGAVEEALESIGCRADVVSLDPSSLDDVIACVGAVGAATGRADGAEALMTSLRARVDRVRAAVAGAPRSRVLALEWYDPPFNAGHWVPDMIEAAGGEPVLSASGERSRELSWSEIADASADVVLLMPCGYNLARAAEEGRSLVGRREFGDAPLVAVDGDAFFSRPGPRVVDGVEILASVLHPEIFGEPAAGVALPVGG